MGQTLSHGVYLPNEGERNCYAGLASNWQILNTAVGNIAEKAPLVHTHGNITNDGKVGTAANKPLITGTGGAVQAGSFGNQANTFCEGNDSRLSDARTPVAHTHTKSDVTDLLNSNFIPSANNTYDLGSSSYQWNNLYAKNYYYNGVAWGLDKSNTWSQNQNFKNSGWEQGVTPANLTSFYLQFIDKNNASFGAVGFHQDSNGYTFLNILAGDKYANGAKSTNGSLIRNQFRMGTTSAGITYQSFDGYWGSSLTPIISNTFGLGTSTNKWKSLNGINPGALSLPDTLGTSGTENVNYFNIIGYLNNTGTLATIPTTATYDGWLYINAKDGADSYIIIDDSPASFGTSVFGNNGLGSQSIGLLCLMCPIRKGHAYNVRIKSAGIVSARIYPAQGNV